MSKINFRLNSETTKLYEEYREKWNIVASDSQIFRAGLAFLMAMPEAVSGDEGDKEPDHRRQHHQKIQCRRWNCQIPHPSTYSSVKTAMNMRCWLQNHN